MALHAHGDLAEAVTVQEELFRLMNGADQGMLQLSEVEDALERYRDALA